MSEPTFKELKAAAKELNKFIDPKQGEVIKTVAVKSDVLKKDLIEAAKELGLTPDDDLSDETIAALSGIGVDTSDFEIGEIGENDAEELEEEELEEEEMDDEVDDDDLPVDDDLKNLPPTKQELMKTAKELNKLLGLEEPINVKAAIADLTDEIIDVCGSIEPKEFAASEFTETALDVLEKLGVELVFADEKLEEIPVEKPAKTEKKAEKKAKEKPAKLNKVNTDEKPFHPYADLFPGMDDDDFNEIVKDMNENGFRVDRPIILFDGKIADGKNRYKACQIAKVKPVFIEFEGTEVELFKHVIALNLKRRHLTPAQKATLAVDLLPEFEKAAKEQRKSGGQGKKVEKKIRATAAAAKVTGSTKEAVTAAKKVKEKDPKKFQEMKAGKKTIASAKRETQEKTAEDKFKEAEKSMLAKLKMVRTAIHDFFDAAELAEVKTIGNENDLIFIDDTITKIIS